MSTSSELPGWHELLAPSGEQLLARTTELLAGGSTPEQVNRTLRVEGADPALIAASLTQCRLRSQAVPKFGEMADRMLFTQAGLEQASRLPVAEAHAARFAAAGCSSIADLGCGLGAESLAMLRAGLNVRAVEIDPLTAAFATHNLGVQAASLPAATESEVLLSDAESAGAGSSDGVFLDPARRTAGHRDTRRLGSAAEYSPSLDFAFAAIRAARAGGVKLGPGTDRELIPEEAEAEWVSVDGQLVEMCLWFGAAARPNIKRAATVMRTHAGGVTTHEMVARADTADAATRELGEYLYEPDGSVIRARLIGLLAAELDAGMIHPGIAYLTADSFVPTPFAQSFRVLEELPSREKDLRKALVSRDIGTVEIKKRGVDIDPAALRGRLRLKGSQSATVILSRTASRHIALLAERC